MKRPSTAEIYRLLIRTQLRVSFRAVRAQQSFFMWVVLGVMAVYSSFTLLVLGFYFDRFTQLIYPDANPVEVVNRYMLATFISLFFIRFLFQKTPRMKLDPYLHLPFRKRYLVIFFQASSILSIHNAFPLVFFIPFWLRFILPLDAMAGHVFWLLAIIGILLGSHFSNLFLRSVLRQHTGVFYLLMSLFILVTVVDETAGLGMFAGISSYLFEHILAGDLLSFSLIVSLTLLSIVLSSLALIRALRSPESGDSIPRNGQPNIPVPGRLGTTGALVYLELLLMWRNRRPRHYLLVSLLFSTMYLILMLATRIWSGMVFHALIGLFASGGFALNYGQLMFSWDSTHYDGLLTRNIPFRHMVRAKLILLQFSCLVLFFLALPLFYWLRPDLLLLHATFLLYNAGITTVLVMELASRNTNAVDIGKSGSFFNYEGFSARHWLWFLPTALPPTLLLAAMKSDSELGLLILAGLGMVSILATNLWSMYFARGLRNRKYKMGAGFRIYAH